MKVTEDELKKRVSEVNKASKFIGLEVRNTKNEKIGKVADLAFDPESGQIAYAVISSGGFLGVKDKLIAVPVQGLTVARGAKHLLIDVNKAEVERAAGFTEEAWPDLDAVRAGKTIGFTAAATTNTTSAAGGAGSESEQASDRAQSPGAITSLRMVHSAGDPSTIEGKEIQLNQAKVGEMLSQNVFTVSADNSQPVIVKADHPVQQLQAGQTVNVTGVVRKMPTDMSSFGLDATAAQKLQGHKLHIEAKRVTPSPKQ